MHATEGNSILISVTIEGGKMSKIENGPECPIYSDLHVHCTHRATITEECSVSAPAVAIIDFYTPDESGPMKVLCLH